MFHRVINVGGGGVWRSDQRLAEGVRGSRTREEETVSHGLWHGLRGLQTQKGLVDICIHTHTIPFLPPIPDTHTHRCSYTSSPVLYTLHSISPLPDHSNSSSSVLPPFLLLPPFPKPCSLSHFITPLSPSLPPSLSLPSLFSKPPSVPLLALLLPPPFYPSTSPFIFTNPPLSSPPSPSPLLYQEIEKLKRDNEGLQARFLQHGKELLSQNTQSLADEMEDASKDDVRNDAQ